MATKMTREEAIKKVRQMSLPKETMEILEALAPELAESEDERIRKHLIEIVETYWGTTNEPGKAADLAWLEKQKEQKQEKFPPYVTGFKGDPDPAGVWKPSKEQMKALYYACCIAFKEERCFHPSLSRLYHDLRKLIRR